MSRISLKNFSAPFSPLSSCRRLQIWTGSVFGRHQVKHLVGPPSWDALFAGFGPFMVSCCEPWYSKHGSASNECPTILNWYQITLGVLIRIKATIMLYYHSNNSMTHFTFSYVNLGMSIYNTETNMDWNIACFSLHWLLGVLFLCFLNSSWLLPP